MQTVTITLTSNTDTFRNALASQEWSASQAKQATSLAATCHEVKDENTYEILESFAIFKGGSYTLENNIKSMVQTMVEEIGGDKKAGARAVARTLEALEYMENNNGAIAELTLVFGTDGAEVALEAGYDIEEEAETSERSILFLSHAAMQGLVETLTTGIDPWFGQYQSTGTGTAVTYQNIVKLNNYAVVDDYLADWNESVAYRNDKGEVFEDSPAVFTITALGFDTTKMLDAYGELTTYGKQHQSARYMVECPEGLSFSEPWQALAWVRHSILESFGVLELTAA
jgi:hypothetical protein